MRNEEKCEELSLKLDRAESTLCVEAKDLQNEMDFMHFSLLPVPALCNSHHMNFVPHTGSSSS